MNENLLNEVNGKSIFIGDFEIKQFDGKLAVTMTCVCEDQNAYSILFENVSKLQLSNIFYPFQISGFEILDFSSRGYQNDSRFFVNDYEEGQLSFYCEDFEISDANR